MDEFDNEYTPDEIPRKESIAMMRMMTADISCPGESVGALLRFALGTFAGEEGKITWET